MYYPIVVGFLDSARRWHDRGGQPRTSAVDAESVRLSALAECFFDLPETLELDPRRPNQPTRPLMVVFVLACCRSGFRFRLTFEIDQSTYAILEHVTEWGPYVDFW